MPAEQCLSLGDNLPSTTLEPFPGLCKRTLADLRKIQQEDDTVGPLLKAVEEQQCPLSNIGKSRKFQLSLQQRKQLYINNGLLFRCHEDCEGKEKWYSQNPFKLKS